jgi:hypothetical protein
MIGEQSRMPLGERKKSEEKARRRVILSLETRVLSQI